MESPASRVVDAGLKSFLGCWLKNDMAKAREQAWVVLLNFFDDPRPQASDGVDFHPIPYGRGTAADNQQPILYGASVRKQSGATVLAIEVQFPAFGQSYVDWEFRLASPSDRVDFSAPERPEGFNERISDLRSALRDWE